MSDAWYTHAPVMPQITDAVPQCDVSVGMAIRTKNAF